MVIRKICRFLWYQNRNNFEKNEKRKDQAPLNQNWACFEHYLKIINYLKKNDLIILKQIVWESSKMAFKF